MLWDELKVGLRPAEHVTDDLNSWIYRARAHNWTWADYGESIWIPQQGRVIKDWEHAPYSASQLAKAYLKRQAFPWDLRRFGEAPPRPPMWFRGPAAGDWCYIDLKRAWWQIGSRLPWFVDFSGRHTNQGAWTDAEEFGEVRRPRLNLFGMLAYPGGTTTWHMPDGSTKLATCPEERSRIANQPWGSAILRVVTSVASEVFYEFPGVILWHTDGCLVPSQIENEVKSWLLDRWKLTSTTKERGAGLVAGPGNYEWRPTFRPTVLSEAIEMDDSDPPGKILTRWLRYQEIGGS